MKSMMRSWLVALACSLPLQLFGKAEVHLIESMLVTPPSVTLGQIASIESTNAALKKELSALIVSSAPRIGSRQVLSSLKIRSIIEKAGFEEVTVHGLQTALRTEKRVVEKSEIEQMVRDWLQGQNRAKNDLEITFTRLPQQWTIPAGDAVQLTVRSSKQQLGGTMPLSLRAVANGKVYSTAHARVQVHLFQEVLVLNRPLKKGQKLSAHDVSLQRADVTTANGMEVMQPEHLIGLVAKQNLPAGKLARITDFALPIIIERGSLNRIAVVNAGVTMMVTGAQALQQGKKGDRILFSNPMNANEPLVAEVVRKGFALIKLQ
jgi:flagella basal body P-ring formation protein FlgA